MRTLNPNIPSNHELQQLIKEIKDISQIIVQKDWAESNAGNFSSRLTFIPNSWLERIRSGNYQEITLSKDYPALNGKFFLVKGSGKRLRETASDPEKTVCIGRVHDRRFQIIWPIDCPFQPTSELNSHLAIQQYNFINHRLRKTVLHAHATESIALSLLSKINDSQSLNDILWRILPETSILIPDGVGYLDFEVPSSSQLEEKTLALINNHRIILWKNHGLIATEVSLTKCLDLMTIINKSAKVYLLAKPNPDKMLSNKELAIIEQAFWETIKKNQSEKKWSKYLS